MVVIPLRYLIEPYNVRTDHFARSNTRNAVPPAPTVNPNACLTLDG